MSIKINNLLQIDKLYTVFLTEYKTNYKFHGESHNFWELLCILEGEASVTADGNIFTLVKGQAILHPPMQFHNLSSIGPNPLCVAVFTFSGKNIPSIYNRICQIHDISFVKTLYETAKQTFKFDDIWITDTISKNNSSHFFTKQLEILLLNLSENTTESFAQVSQGAKNYSLIVNTLYENINQRLDISDIAKLCNMSKINLQKTFSKYAGVGIMEYFTRIKMHRATTLLEQGESVKETALSLGYFDQNYFSTVYKRITGHTPTYSQKKNQKSV